MSVDLGHRGSRGSPSRPAQAPPVVVATTRARETGRGSSPTSSSGASPAAQRTVTRRASPLAASPRARQASSSPSRRAPFATGEYTDTLRTPPAKRPAASGGTGGKSGQKAPSGAGDTPTSTAHSSTRGTALVVPRAVGGVDGAIVTGESPEPETVVAGSRAESVHDASAVQRASPGRSLSPTGVLRLGSPAGRPNSGAALSRSAARSSPTRRPTSPVRRAPTRSPRSSPSANPAPVPYTMESREGRITTLLCEFDMKSLRPWGSRVDEIATRFRRLNYVSEEELRFLKHAKRRNEAFLHNLKHILKEAVREGVGVESSIAKQSKELSDDATQLNERISELIRFANKPADVVAAVTTRRARSRSGSVGSAAGSDRDVSETRSEGGHSLMSATSSVRTGTSVRSSFAGSSVRSPTKSRVVGVAPVPTLSEMPRPTARRVPHAAPPQNIVNREDRRRMLEGIVALEQRSSLAPTDLEWAQTIFDRLYGVDDGPVRFELWCRDLASTPLVVRPSYYAAGGSGSSPSRHTTPPSRVGSAKKR